VGIVPQDHQQGTEHITIDSISKVAPAEMCPVRDLQDELLDHRRTV
jgi:hypothetical protein